MDKAAIILVGLSYSGKTAVGRIIADRLGWPFVDTDDQVVALAGGKSIPDIFAEWGEARFRGLESQSLGLACGRGRAVISTGGGVVLNSGNRAMLTGSGIVVWLDAQPSTLYQRLLTDQQGNTDPTQRPLLQGDDALGKITSLKEQRLSHYASVADWVVATDQLTPEEVAEEALHAYGRLRGKLRLQPLPIPELEPDAGDDSPHAGGAPATTTGAVAVVATNGGTYPIFVGPKLLNGLASRLERMELSNTVYVISDENVFSHYGERVMSALHERGIAATSYVIPAGEQSKRLDVVEGIYQWLVGQRAERSHTILALGGGVVGDLSGYVAASYLRGMPYVQAPTTLLAMVDASIGGKTGVNLAEAKNLVGSFYQPKMVLIDVELLRTLGKRELTEGWAEVIKHALIRDPVLLEEMESGMERLIGLDTRVVAHTVAASAAIKAEVVSEDERESGVRAILNYGHTIGHGLEAATGYQGFLHGEAVAVGMMGAARISQRMGLLHESDVERQRRIIVGFGLPTRSPGVDLDGVRAAMAFDKKVQNKKQRWVLLDGLGNAVVRDDVPPEVVEETLQELSAE